MSVDMSFVNPFNLTFEPDTLPACEYGFSFIEPSCLESSPYDRAGSHFSQSTAHSESPEPEVQLPILDEAFTIPRRQLATPRRTPIRSHGPQLLPKIRNQDQLDAPAPAIHSRKRQRSPLEQSPSVISQAKRSKILTNGSWKPGHARSFTNPETTYVPAHTPQHSRHSSQLCSPISMAGTSTDAQLSNMSSYRRASSVSSAGLDSSTLSKFGYPTYRATPTYVSSSDGIETFVPAYTLPPREPSPLGNPPATAFNDFAEDDFSYAETLALDFDTAPLSVPDEPTTTLQAYLTAPNPSPSLVRQLNIQHREPGAKSFWWDVRQVRPWTSFNMQTFNSIPGLSDLLNVSVPLSSLSSPSTIRNAQPETESELLRLYSSFYASKLNTALAVGMGSRHLAMKTVPSSSNSVNEAHFVSNYTDDTSFLVLNRPSARVVGLVLSFDRWNSSMRVDGNNHKVNYLRGLAKLHGVMRDYGCRYGFIMTEIELLVVRNGSDSTPNFGFLEVQSIPLAQSSDSRSSSVDSTHSEDDKPEQKMTAMQALFFLNMLAKDVPLPNQPSWQSAIGAPAEGTRRKHLGKDTWIPEPQLAEKREAKRMRGWVWPEEAVGRKELGRKGIRYNKC